MKDKRQVDHYGSRRELIGSKLKILEIKISGQISASYIVNYSLFRMVLSERFVFRAGISSNSVFCIKDFFLLLLP